MNGSSPPTEIRVAADPMIVFRAEQLEARTGYSDPHAKYFLTDGSRALAKVAERLDPMFAPFNLARFVHFSQRMAAVRQPQMLVLGAGYDTRPLWLKGLAGRQGLRVYEVDFALVLEGKAAILKDHGVRIPSSVVPVPADLNEPGLLAALKRHGFDPELPTAVFAEGVLFFLLAASISRLLDPRTLQLAPGSSFSFDFWSGTRTNNLNVALIASTGQPMFETFPLPDSPAALEKRLRAMGYASAEVLDLKRIADDIWPREDHSGSLGPWRVVHAAID